MVSHRDEPRDVPGGYEWVACALCGADDATPVATLEERHVGSGGRFTLVACRSCGLRYLNPRPRPELMEGFYPDTYSAYAAPPSWAGPLATFGWRRRATRLARLAPAGGHVLDVGCGAGDLVAALRRTGLAAEGIEPNPHAADIARRKNGGHVRQGTLAVVDVHQREFDLVVLVHVLEHCPDPGAVLAQARSLLREGGRLYVEVPNAESLEARAFGSYWGGWDAPRHLHHFSPHTLRSLLERNGVRVTRLSFLPSTTNLAWSVFNLLGGGSRSSGVRRLLYGLRPLIKLGLAPFCALQALAGCSGVMAAVGETR